AQRLHALGESVALLVMFDVSFYSFPFTVFCARLRAGSDKVVGHLRWMMRELSWSEIPGHLRKHLRRLGQEDKETQDSFERRRLVSQYEYRPLPYDGRVLLLRRSTKHSRWTRARQDWQQLVRGRFDAFDIPGDHESMFEKPHVVITAEKLGAT